MTADTERLEAALAAGPTEGPWFVDPDDRPDMEWNNHLLGSGGNTICFMAHNPKDNTKLEATVHYIAACDPATIRALLAENKAQAARIAELEPLSLRGLATMPRPISEAPKEGTPLLVIGGGCKKWEIRASDPDWWNRENSGSQPTHFIPLSALTEPKP